MLHWIDITIIVVYLLFIIVLGLYYSSNTTGKKNYFLAGKNISWILVGTSMFATNISSEHFIGLASAGYSSGLLLASYDLLGAVCCVFLAYFFGPRYLKLGIYTLPEYIEYRYNSSSRWFLSVVSIIAYILTKISMILLAGSILIQQVAGIDIYTSSLCLITITGLYAISGGVKAISHTSFFQTIVLILGTIVITVVGLSKIGGIGNLVEKTPSDFWDIIRPISDKNFPWTGVLFGIPIIATWYHCTDQYMVQQYLTAKNINHATTGSILTAYLKLLPIFFLIVPGITAYILYPNISSDSAFPTLILNLLGPGLKGIVIAGFLAALTSSLAASFNSCSTLFTFDIYQKLYPNANDFILVNIGRIATLVIIVFALVWVTFLKDISGEMYLYLQNVSAYIAPPITAVFFMGMLWKRANSKAALTTLITGFVIGISKLITETLIRNQLIKHGFLYYLGSITFLHFACVLFVFSIFLIIFFSLITKSDQKPSMFNIEKNADKSYMHKDSKWVKFNYLTTLFLLLLVITIYLIFSN